MFTFITQSGMFGFLQVVLMIVAAAFAALSGIELYRENTNRRKAAENINNIVRTGILSAALGFLGTVYGGYEALGEIMSASEISMRIVYEGIRWALSSTILGFQIFFFTAVVWFLLKLKLGVE
ncbi:MAG: MotA/TolQ/ExbB proton channel family protein [Melioribacteraceae bacterium]|nr:MotA/TolQ/ExbB proton channel family protein [Melioribacteraceae bacterium]